jgi:phthalate 4,5-dioxygenase oxygenase subunit
MRVRQLLLRAAREFIEGKTPTQADNPELDYRAIRSVGGVIPPGTDWRSLADQ